MFEERNDNDPCDRRGREGCEYTEEGDSGDMLSGMYVWLKLMPFP
jgi:hypothetical protein